MTGNERTPREPFEVRIEVSDSEPWMPPSGVHDACGHQVAVMFWEKSPNGGWLGTMGFPLGVESLPPGDYVIEAQKLMSDDGSFVTVGGETKVHVPSEAEEAAHKAAMAERIRRQDLLRVRVLSRLKRLWWRFR